MESNEVKNEGYNNENTEIIDIPSNVSNNDTAINVENTDVNVSENNSEMELPKKEENIVNDNVISNETDEPISVPVDPIKAASEHINSNATEPSESDLFKPVGESSSIDQPVSSNASISNNNDFMIKKDKKIWPIVLVVVLLLIVGLGCSYYFVIMSPKNIFTKTIDVIYTKIDNNLKSYNDIYGSKDYKIVDGNILFTLSEPKLNLNLDYYVAENIKDKKAYLETNVKMDDKDIISATVYNEKDMIYLLSKELYNKAVGIKLAENELTSIYENVDVDIEDVRHITSLFKDTIKNNINYDKVTKTLKTDSGLYFETVYNFDKEEAKNLSEALKKSLLEDKKVLEILNKISSEEITKEDLKEMLDYFFDNDENSEILDTKFILHTDVINNNVSYFEVSNKEAEATVKINGEESNVVFKNLENNEEMLNVKIDNNSVSGTVYGTETDASGKGTSLKVVFSIKNNKSNDKVNETTSSFSAYIGDSKDPLMTVALTSKIDLTAEPKEFDKSNVIMSDQITEEDMMTIQLNMMSVMEKLGLQFPMDNDSDLVAQDQ